MFELQNRFKMLKVLRTEELVSALGVLIADLFTYQACAIYSGIIAFFTFHKSRVLEIEMPCTERAKKALSLYSTIKAVNIEYHQLQK